MNAPTRSKVSVSDSSGNVFEDLGRPCADEKKLKARRAAKETTALNQQDSKTFADALLDPPEPNEALRNAAARYKWLSIPLTPDVLRGMPLAVIKRNLMRGMIPPTLGACADALYTLREQRLLTEKQAEAIKARETAIRDYLINELPKDDSTGTSGHLARAQIKTKRVPQVDDWEALYEYVTRTGAFELLQRRLANDAVAERWDAGEKVPGVGAFNTVTVSVTKL